MTDYIVASVTHIKEKLINHFNHIVVDRSKCLPLADGAG